MEEFKDQRGGVLTDQQKTLMEAFEEKRKERLAEAKLKDPGNDALFKPTSIYHGNGGVFN